MKYRNDIRNIAIIAHVDHGKTTMVDALLKQGKVFRDNQAVGEQIMDQNALERERRMTIMAKNTAIIYKGVKINIIDTPGHADFGGEVERVISMADGCLLLVDSVDGPMPQTKSVLRQALRNGLKPIVLINKIDRADSRIAEVVRVTQDLFLELATSVDQLDFPVLFASGRDGIVVTEPGAEGKDVSPLFDTILEKIPPPRIKDGPFQMLVSNLDYDSHKGTIAIGRIWRGKVASHDQIVCIGADGALARSEVSGVFTYERIALSFGLSIAVVPIIGLFLKFTPWGLALGPVLYAVSSFVFITSIIAGIRRHRLTKQERFRLNIHLKVPNWRVDKRNIALSIVLVATIVGAVGMLAYMIATPAAGERFTEFYIAGTGGKTTEYPVAATLGNKAEVTVGIVNRERKVTNYQLEISLDRLTVAKVDSVVLANGQKWEQQVGFIPDKVGDKQRVELLLYKDGEAEPYRTLYFLIDVRR